MCKQGQTKILEIKNGKKVDVDECIYSLVQALNDAGFATVACCCGHGHRPGNIALADGRELIIAPDYGTGRMIDKMFPNIQGETTDSALHSTIQDTAAVLNKLLLEMSRRGKDVGVQIVGSDSDLHSPKSNPQIVVRVTELVPYNDKPTAQIKPFKPEIVS